MDSPQDAPPSSEESLDDDTEDEGITQSHVKGAPRIGKTDGGNKRRRGSEFFDDVAEEDEEEVGIGKSFAMHFVHTYFVFHFTPSHTF